MSFSFRIQIIALFILFHCVPHAQNRSCFKNICLSPPLPPYFKPIHNASFPSSRSGNNYSIPFDTITFNHTLGTQAFDMVICIDGVIDNTQISFADNYIDSLVARLQTVAHYNPRFKYFNIYRIAKLSNEEGSAWGFSGDTTVDNRYGSRFNAFNLSRLLIPEKVDTLFTDVEEFVPEYDLILLLTFDKKYGGSGYTLYDGRKIASSSIDMETGWHLSDEVFIHEMQHIMPFAGHGYLGDEYEDSISCLIYDSIPESPNFTSDTTTNRKWQHCMGLPNIGFYPEAGICPDNFRPSPQCAMRQVYNLPDFCPVCRENSTAYFDSVINPIYNFSPVPIAFTGTHTFFTQVDTPLVNTFRYQWMIDDSLLATGQDFIQINFDSLDKTNNHLLKFICTDIDAFIIDTTLRRPWITEWNLLTRDTTLAISEAEEHIAIDIFPNPAINLLHGILRGNPQSVAIEIIATDGRIMMKNILRSRDKFEVDISFLVSGIYSLALKTEGQFFTKKFVKY